MKFIKMKRYNDFNSVEELMEYYNIKPLNIILEKNDDIKASEELDDNNVNEPEKVIKSDEIEVTYSDINATPTNIFKHIIVFTNDSDPKNNKTLKNIKDAIKSLKDA